MFRLGSTSENPILGRCLCPGPRESLGYFVLGEAALTQRC